VEDTPVAKPRRTRAKPAASKDAAALKDLGE
jgi:hypothetical protein